SRIGLPVRRGQTPNTGGGEGLPGEKASRRADRKAACFIAPPPTREAGGAGEESVGFFILIICTLLCGGVVFCRGAVGANRSGNIARPPRPKVKAKGGEPTKTSSGVTLRTSLA